MPQRPPEASADSVEFRILQEAANWFALLASDSVTAQDQEGWRRWLAIPRSIGTLGPGSKPSAANFLPCPPTPPASRPWRHCNPPAAGVKRRGAARWPAWLHWGGGPCWVGRHGAMGAALPGWRR
ncbi:hypothetical protein G6F46_014762 [Rhizopus delemar]|nr:hypothetical protein G6F46_014762 [Rhizopus delemar]